MEKSKFKVIIVGGSVAGQTLSLALEKANIDYVLLEKHESFAPEVGASIGIFANGMRVLDQLGICNEIETRTEPILVTNKHDEKGNQFDYNDILGKLSDRHGYTINFMERKDLLAIMYAAQPNKSKLLCNKRVDSIEQGDNGVKVTTSDGSEYEGDIVVGADGVWSKVRQMMWNAMDADKTLTKDMAKDLAKDKTVLTCEYACVFGISYNVTSIPPGHNNLVFRHGSSFLILSGKNGTVYWFYFEKLDKKYAVPNIPRYTEEDAIKTCEKHLDAIIAENVTFRELWVNRKSAIKVALEEGVMRRWHYSRFVVLGDAAHKMTPNMGQGGNSAIESAAILSNCLKSALDKNSQQLNSKQIDECLSLYQSERRKRIKSVYTRAGDATRMEAMDSMTKVIMARYIIPSLGEKLILKLVGDLLKDAPSLDFVDKPTRAHLVPYADEKPKKKKSIFGF
ncbi:hypothetical protein INT44_009115 [Umbelopsis vinacea]|uniref:FAD-binding domain-containing protein n=1 Tax=Umbelopsis vinacea TaxID=44442 RepID=A0A8H7UI98_9FUNG|nr:hypothetical protein INT44_009115 [Umbelopsis vinacea]